MATLTIYIAKKAGTIPTAIYRSSIKNAYLVSKEHTLKGDSLYYERNNGYGEAFNNVQLTDTLNKIILTGNQAKYFEFTQNGMLTDSAQMMQVHSSDTLFLHADTIRALPIRPASGF
ncbi:MAG: hypothetical protein HC896_02785 [Bacteroidales bacterium]|nr:hypothetical protein [Bacteroidales bacterium]